jgi:hypothetical protein
VIERLGPPVPRADTATLVVRVHHCCSAQGLYLGNETKILFPCSVLFNYLFEALNFLKNCIINSASWQMYKCFIRAATVDT